VNITEINIAKDVAVLKWNSESLDFSPGAWELDLASFAVT
jgi:hypothetical protein